MINWCHICISREKAVPLQHLRQKTIKRIVDIIITILTALLTTVSAQAAGLV